MENRQTYWQKSPLMNERSALDMILPTVKKNSSRHNTASYEIEPLEPGYGMTIGTALKRVLFSSLTGAAVTAIRVNGLESGERHIEGVQEELQEILLNIKQVRLRCLSQQAVSFHLVKTGKGVVLTADMLVPTEIEVLNPAHIIATLVSEESNFDIELVVENGRGYSPAEQRVDCYPGFLPIDAIYTPVFKVTMAVERARVGNKTNYDKICLEITTDGTITPDEAIQQSGQILTQQFLELSIQKVVSPEGNPTHSSIPIPLSIYELPLEQLALSPRTYNNLKRAGKTLVGHILTMEEDQLRRIRNFGGKSLNELTEKLSFFSYLPFSEERDMFLKDIYGMKI